MRILNSSVNNSNQELLYKFTNGVEIDSYLYKQEINVQKSWVSALKKIGIFNSEEEKSILDELNVISHLMENEEFPWSIADEDIHMNIESHLTEKLGELGKKVHLGRSRNDLIATTLRLYVKDSLIDLADSVSALKTKINEKADEWKDVVVPGLTHAQAGMPVSLKLIFGSHAEAMQRDLVRISNAQYSCMDYCPLGAAALAGTHLDIDLTELSQSLGFKNPVQNTYDAVGDRDFILESLNGFSTLAVHLSRMCEELIYYSSSYVGLMALPPGLSTGSSIMPNKRNPDVLELIRAKMSKVISSSSEGANLVRATLPSYGSDLHELKEVLQRSKESLFESLKILAPFVEGLSLDKAQAVTLCEKGHVLATDITNYLCATGMSFRDAYGSVAELVQQASVQGKQVHQVLNNDEKSGFWTFLEKTRGLSQKSFAKKDISFDC